MKIRDNIDYVAFLQTVRSCAGQVFFCTTDGDKLNLKSMLSEYIFITVAMSSDLIQGGIVNCDIPEDYTRLSEYLREDS